jgi:ATP-dependent helicase/DNAse subunit B
VLAAEEDQKGCVQLLLDSGAHTDVDGVLHATHWADEAFQLRAQQADYDRVMQAANMKAEFDSLLDQIRPQLDPLHHVVAVSALVGILSTM